MFKNLRYLTLTLILLLVSVGIASAAHKTGTTLRDDAGRNVGYASFEATDTGVSLFMSIEGVDLGTGKYSIMAYDAATCDTDAVGVEVGTVILFNDGAGADGYFGLPVEIDRSRLSDMDGGAIMIGGAVCGTFNYIPPAPVQ